MIGKISLAAGLVVLATAFGPSIASAASIAPQSTLGVTKSDSSLVQTVQWRRCRAWRNECAARWGWRTRGYFRCVARHGC